MKLPNISAAARSGDGYGRGEGFVAIVLRRQQLHSEGAAIALICGSAINQDGRSSGLTAPNGPSQTALVRCGCSVQYVHGRAVAA